jgi:hypothetical protein
MAPYQLGHTPKFTPQNSRIYETRYPQQATLCPPAIVTLSHNLKQLLNFTHEQGVKSSIEMSKLTKCVSGRIFYCVILGLHFTITGV